MLAYTFRINIRLQIFDFSMISDNHDKKMQNEISTKHFISNSYCRVTSDMINSFFAKTLTVSLISEEISSWWLNRLVYFLHLLWLIHGPSKLGWARNIESPQVKCLHWDQEYIIFFWFVSCVVLLVFIRQNRLTSISFLCHIF